MGVAGMIIGTLGAAWLQGRAAQEQANAAARQAETNAAIQENNAKKTDDQARQMDEANKINAENERRRAMARLGQQRAAIAASGLTYTGSAANALADTQFDIDQQTGTTLYNGRQNTDKLRQQSTDYTNQAGIYRKEAGDYRMAGQRAMMTSLLGGAFSLASGLYAGNSAAKMGSSGSWSGLPSYTSASGQSVSAGLRLGRTGATWGAKSGANVGLYGWKY